MYISPEYLGRIFKSGTGQSPMSFLISIRLEKAKELLEKEELTVAQISRQIGYNDAYHFSKLFKKHFSISPLAYRKLRDGRFSVNGRGSGRITLPPKISVWI